MKRPSIATGICVALFLTLNATAEAQSRRPRAPRSDSRSDLNPNHERAKIEAEKSYRGGDYDRAIRLTDTVILENRQDHVALYLRASARVEKGLRQRDLKLIREGIADARESIRLAAAERTVNPLYYLPYLYGMTNLSQIEGRKDHAEVGVKIAGQVLGVPDLKSDERANLHFQRGMAYTALENYDSAAQDFEAAIRAESTHMGAHVSLAEAYARAGRHERARETYDRALRAFPRNPLVHNNRGMYLQQQGKLSEAITAFSQAIELDSRYFYALTNRGYALLQSGNPEAAENDLTASLRIQQNQPAVYNLRATARLAQGKVQQAVEDQKMVVRLDPGNPGAYADLGFALFFAENYEGAFRSFEEGARIDSSLRYTNPWQFWALTMLGREDAAKERFADSLEKEAAKRDWIEHLIAYLSGATTDDALLEAIGSGGDAGRTAQRCEAHYFIGLKKAREGMAKPAQEHFEKALATKADQLSAYRGAQLALKRMAVAKAND